MKNKLLPIVISIALFLFHNANYAQAPNLGTAAGYVLFSSTGAISNTGLTHVTGNVGTNSGAITGFGNVNGVMHNADASTDSAKTDLLKAYNQLDTTRPTFQHAALLGNGDTLKAGVYHIAGNSSLTLTLNLDAEGNANAVFIVQINGTLSTATSSQIKLVNGALACNVFWKVEGLVSMGTGTVMKGTVIANNAAIDMNSGVSLEGRALSTTGAVSTTAVSANIPTGCGRAILTGPAAPYLASASCYAIFSGNGSVINNGAATSVTGDVGTNVGSTAGFNPLAVTGTIHLIPDSSTNKCATDLLNVYAYLNTLPYDIQLLFPAQFGQSLVLTPHTYFLNGATTLTDTVFLNAEGNADAVFVIKVTGAFSTGTYATVVLTNGAKASNVFWKIDGEVNINSFSKISGTIVCNNAAIHLNTTVNLNGRALTTSGAVSTADDTATISSPCSTLPVTWIYFRGKSMQKNVVLEWSTSAEMDNGFFTIEKSDDGQHFMPLTRVNALGKTLHAVSDYSFTDQQPYTLGYYRISQTDLDGKKTYYRTIHVRTDVNTAIHTVHYVKGNYIYVETTDAAPGNGTIELYSMDGIKISSQHVVLGPDASTYKIAKPLHSGMYLLYMQSQGVRLYSAKVMVQ